MSIWHRDYNLSEFVDFQKDTMLEAIGLEFTELGEDYLCAKIPVDNRTVQPAGLLHGGASVALAETLGSFGSTLIVDINQFNCVGLEINANHIRSASGGYVFGKATPLHIGKSTHIWSIRIVNEADKLVCISRITIAIIQKK